MDREGDRFRTVWLIGRGKLVDSIAASLENAKQKAAVLDPDVDWPSDMGCDLAIAITREDTNTKRQLIQRMEDRLPDHAIIAVNCESMPLSDVQAGSRHPSRIVGLNWSFPADLTLFLEIITNDITDAASRVRLEELARQKWGKDPYISSSGFSLRARLMAAWAREAIYLVENDYASMESVDRACRNDAGYYLPFAGNFRYMDLMGTYAYGTVMKDLNPELSKDTAISDAIAEAIAAYAPKTSEAKFRQFSEEILALILKNDHETFDS